MDERRDPEPETGTQRAGVGRGRLTPPKEAWSSYVQHCRRCLECQDVDRGACPESNRLYQAWQLIAAGALRAIARGA